MPLSHEAAGQSRNEPMIEKNLPLDLARNALSRRTFFRGSLLAAGALGVAGLVQGSQNLAQGAKNKTEAVPPRDPLAPLSPDEIVQVVEIIRGSEQVPKHPRCVTVTLREPARDIVAKHAPDKPFPREAFVVLLDNAT